MKIKSIIHLAILCIFFANLTPAQAQLPIKARMKQRLPEINELKTAGKVGENLKGYLEPRGQLSAEQQKIVQGENSDRKKVYTMIAKKTKGASPEKVGRLRAVQISQKAVPGTLIQAKNGTWITKK